MYQAIVFDKDGTLFDFHATFGEWAVALLDRFSDGDTQLFATLAEALRFNVEHREFHPDSLVIAGSNLEIATLLSPNLAKFSLAEIEQILVTSSVAAPIAPIVPLDPLLRTLKSQNLRLGVMTNDAESAAHAQLSAGGIFAHFDMIVGADSGHGAKPDAAPLLATCHGLGVAPDAAIMVGDSTHDLIAGRAAGMTTVAVLSGLASAQTLSPYADVVLADIGAIPDWLNGQI
jgi:phosphoglycolate phosphatase